VAPPSSASKCLQKFVCLLSILCLTFPIQAFHIREVLFFTSRVTPLTFLGIATRMLSWLTARCLATYNWYDLRGRSPSETLISPPRKELTLVCRLRKEVSQVWYYWYHTIPYEKEHSRERRRGYGAKCSGIVHVFASDCPIRPTTHFIPMSSFTYVVVV